MNLLRLYLILLLFNLFNYSRADEGMWLPILLKDTKYEEMVKKGLKLPAEAIYSINNSSLKDAVALFGGGCSCELVSDKGLIFTNHHCGYGTIQEHSSLDNDLLTNG
ncbi:MAG: S46 family peptidase, partial [Bacteroidales bacterium]|nr:S46 family peptidase [Bacteroidales bacterium]